jgi:thiosulfate reductase/polysulfide reductase chain A
MSNRNNSAGRISRRSMLKLTGAAAVGTALAGGGAWRCLARGQAAARAQGQQAFLRLRHVFQQMRAHRPGGGRPGAQAGPQSPLSEIPGHALRPGQRGHPPALRPQPAQVSPSAQGRRGEGKWQRSPGTRPWTWPRKSCKASDERYTRCGTVFNAGTDTQSTFVHRFAEAYGSYNVISHESNCLISRNRAFLDTFGVMPIPDTLNCRIWSWPGPTASRRWSRRTAWTS